MPILLLTRRPMLVGSRSIAGITPPDAAGRPGPSGARAGGGEGPVRHRASRGGGTRCAGRVAMALLALVANASFFAPAVAAEGGAVAVPTAHARIGYES